MSADASTTTLTSSPPPTYATPTWLQYQGQCHTSGITDLYSLDMTQIVPYLQLNQYQRDLLSRTVPAGPYRLYRAGMEMIEKNICVTCWLVRNCCMCSSLQQFSSRHKTFIFMHQKEFGRGSNTGKLAVRSMRKKGSEEGGATDNSVATSSSSSSTSAPTVDTSFLTSTSSIIQADIPLQEQALIDLCNREPLNTVVLFPSDDAITIEEFVKVRGWRLPEVENSDNTATATDHSTSAPPVATATVTSSSSSNLLPLCPPLNIILLDGTWREARTMKNSRLPQHIPAIRIDPFKYPLDGTLRKEEERTEMEKDLERVKVSEPQQEEEKAEEKDDDNTASASGDTKGKKPKKSKPTAMSQRDPRHLDGKIAHAPKKPAANNSSAVASASSSDVTFSSAAAASSSAVASSPPPRTFVSLFYPLRRQSQPDRISTIEALVILLKELHEPDSVTHQLLDLLRILVDSMRVQSGMNTVYGTFTKEESRRMRTEIAKPKVHVPPPVDAQMIVDPKGRVNYVAAAVSASSDNTAAASSSSSDASSSSSSSYRVTRNDRRQRASALRPCMQWNRGLACRASPCLYTHMCMLCNSSSHRASECEKSKDTQKTLEEAAKAAGCKEVLPIREMEAAAAASSSSSTNQPPR